MVLESAQVLHIMEIHFAYCNWLVPLCIPTEEERCQL